jgi:hypothetical protein
MTRLCDIGPGDVKTTTDAISNLHQWRRLTEKVSPDIIYNSSTATLTIIAPSDVGTTMEAIGNGSYGLHKEASPDAIHNGSTSTSTTPLHRKVKSSVIVDGSASTPTTRHYAI